MKELKSWPFEPLGDPVNPCGEGPVKLPLTVLNHKKIARGTLRSIIRDAELSVEEFLELLE